MSATPPLLMNNQPVPLSPAAGRPMPPMQQSPSLSPFSTLSPMVEQPNHAALLDVAQRIQRLPEADVVVVLAHPDDEVFISGTLYQLAQQGKRVQVVYASDGNRGRDVSGHRYTGDVLGHARQGEARDAIQRLNIEREPLILPLTDGETAAQAPLLQTLLNAVLRQTRPTTLLTFHPDNGITGHVDHKMVGTASVRAVEQLAGAGVQAPNLYFFVLGPEAYAGFRQSFPPHDPSWEFVVPYNGSVLKVFTDADTIARKSNALRQHATQFPMSDVAGFFAFNGRYPYEDFVAYQPQNQASSDLEKMTGFGRQPVDATRCRFEVHG